MRTPPQCVRRPSTPPFPHPLNPPVHHFSTVVYPDTSTLRHSSTDSDALDTLHYGRLGSPGTHTLEAAIATLTHAHGALVTPSKGAALVAALTTWTRAGDTVAIPTGVCVEARPAVEGLLPRLGVRVREYASVEELRNGGDVGMDRVVLLEAPVGPRFEPVVSMEEVRGVREVWGREVVFVLDNCGGSVRYEEVFPESGNGVVDIAVTSADRSGGVLDGSSSLSFGVITCRDERVYRKMRAAVRGSGGATAATASPDCSERALLAMRSATARRAVQLQNRRHILSVLRSNSFPELRQIWTHADSLDIGLMLDDVDNFIGNLRVINIGDGVGGGQSVSLVWPDWTRHNQSYNCVTLSTGLEHIADIEFDIRQALDICTKLRPSTNTNV